MSLSPPPPRLHPAHALCVYAEPLASGRRVVVVGDSSLELGAILVEAGARTVHVYDPSRERARENAGIARGVTVRELPGEFEVRDGAFDLALVPDLATVGDPPGLLARLRRLVGAGGAVLVCARNPDLVGPGPDTIDYTDLFDMVSIQFAHVRMIGQVPFFGVTLAELGVDEEPEVSVDTRLGPEDKTPHVFLALASQHELATPTAPYALIELPAPPAGVTLRPDDAALRAALAEARLRAEALAMQLDEARAAGKRAASEAEGSSGRRVAELQAHLAAVEARAGEHFARAERLAAEVLSLQTDLARHRGGDAELKRLGAEVQRMRARAVELEEQTSDYKRMRAISEVELMAARASISELEEKLTLLLSELDAVRAATEVPGVAAEAIALLAERAEAGERAAELVAQLESALVHAAEMHAGELGQIEASLRERGRAVKQLEHEILRRERLVRELVGALEEARAPATAVGSPAHAAEVAHENEALRAKLDELALHFARQKGDAQAYEWRVSELERKLAMAAAKSAATTPSGPSSTELDALRQALAQEHEARVRAESGEALTKAHAELSRQATLIEQLSRELDQEGTRTRRQAEPLAPTPTPTPTPTPAPA